MIKRFEFGHLLFIGLWMTMVVLMVACAASSKHEAEAGIERDTSSGPESTNADTVTGISTKDFLMGRFDPAAHPDFVEIDAEYADREGMYLQHEVYDAFKAMYRAAMNDGVNLQIRSATRNFDYQKGIWERKWTGMTLLEDKINAMEAYPDPVDRALRILQFSAMPGSSRHHWGTEVDLNAFTNSWFESGDGLKVYQWLTEHAAQYGFCQPYTEVGAGRNTGYEQEKWHWSYHPLSSGYLEKAAEILFDEEISGFLGSETTRDIKIVENYILGVSESCK